MQDISVLVKVEIWWASCKVSGYPLAIESFHNIFPNDLTLSPSGVTISALNIGLLWLFPILTKTLSPIVFWVRLLIIILTSIKPGLLILLNGREILSRILSFVLLLIPTIEFL